MRSSLSVLVASMALTFVALPACHPREPQGPAEKAGRSVDDAARKTKDAAKDAAHDTKRDLDDHR